MNTSTTTNLNTLNKYFIECMSSFVQDVDGPVIQKIREVPLFSINQGTYEIDYDHPLFGSEYFQANWSIEILAREFLLKYLIYSKPSVRVFSEIKRSMALRLVDNFENALYGVESDVISAIAGERYESAEGKGLSISIIPRTLSAKQLKKCPGAVVFKPEARMRLSIENVHGLRKQLNMSEGGSMAVGLSDATDTHKAADFYTIGLLPVKKLNSFPHIHFTGHMEWCYCVPIPKEDADRIKSQARERKRNELQALVEAQCRLVYKHGRLQVPKIDPKMYYASILNILLEKIDEENNINKNNIISKVIDLIEEAKEQKHGTVLIISNSAYLSDESARLCQKSKRGIELIKPIDVMKDSNILKRLTSIDGAAFVDFDGKCHACGVILDGTAKAQGDMSRGARYNSTKNYLENMRMNNSSGVILGIVVSEDGMVNVL